MKTTLQRLTVVLLAILSLATANAQLSELEGKSITVGEPATTLQVGQWYLMKNIGRSAYIQENASNGLIMNAANPDRSSASQNCGYLIRLVASATAGQYHLQTGYGHFFKTLTSGSNNGTEATANVSYSYGAIASAHFYFKELTSGYILDGNASGGTLAGWGTVAPTSTGGNNDYQLLPVTLVTTEDPGYFDPSKLYTLRTADDTYLELDADDNDGGRSNVASAAHYSDSPVPFTIAWTGNGFTLTDENNHSLGVSSILFWNACNTSAHEWTISPVEGIDNGYTIQCQHGYLHNNDVTSAGSPIYTNNRAATWYIEPVAEPVSVQVTELGQLTSGKCYRFVNVGTSTKAMCETDGRVRGAVVSEAMPNQVWRLTGSASQGFTFQNLMTGNYIQASTSRSVSNPYPTAATTGKAFPIGVVSADDGTFYIEGHNATNGLNYNNAYNSVQNWDWATDHGSQWTIYEVLNTEELQASVANYNSLSTLTTEQLLRFFSDEACTALKAEYAGLSDAELTNRLSGLPDMVCDMVKAVKTSTWESAKDATYNQYVKNFRIADYEVYTNCNWNQITQVGPFAMLYNPTGITVTPGQTLLVMACNNAAASDAELLLHIVSDTNRYPDQTVTLHKGLNVVYTEAEGEVFIDYTLNNAEGGTWNGHTVSQYPDIKVHIEGGQCTGMWDMHRGMTNDQWTWLKNHMFKAPFLHVKGHSTVLNLKTSLVTSASQPEEIMKAWDFVFDTEESIAGCDQWRSTGAYKPLINSRHSYSGSPNWDGGHGTNHPDLTASSIFNSDNLYNTGENGGAIWVISHEEGHGHQNPIKLAGTTEQTNNSLANIVNLLWNLQETTLTKRSDRHDGVKGLLERYNNYPFSWVDYAGQRDVSDGFSSLWIANKWFYQLWLYFDFLGNYQPEGGNTGFSFTTELYNRMRADGISYSSNASSPAPSTSDYLKLCKHCADIVGADLSEYFQIWGFFQTTPACSNSDANHPDIAASNTWYLGDYGSYYIQTSADDAAAVKAYMQTRYGDNKLSNIVFIEGRGGEDDTWLTYNNAPATSFGETGFYRNFMAGISEGYGYTIAGNTVTMTDGKGAVGFKIYDQQGNLKWISNFNTFTVSNEVANGLKNGTYTLKIASGTGADIALGDIEWVSIGRIAHSIQTMLQGGSTITKATIQTLVDKLLMKTK